jgi:hypothetical protein
MKKNNQLKQEVNMVGTSERTTAPKESGKKIPTDGRCTRALWDALKVGQWRKGSGGSAAYWTSELAPKRFVYRRKKVWRAA